MVYFLIVPSKPFLIDHTEYNEFDHSPPSREVCPVDVGGHGGKEHGEEVGRPAALLRGRRARRGRCRPAFGTTVLVPHAVVLGSIFQFR